MKSATYGSRWLELANSFDLQLPVKFLDILEQEHPAFLHWRFLDPDEARELMAELDTRYNYPDCEWSGVPFARSTVSEDIVCFDLQTPPAFEAKIIPIRDWHGPAGSSPARQKISPNGLPRMQKDI
jgi:hypothetical protein